MTQYWFAPKAYGYGATPVTWQGWLATFAFAAVIALLTLSVWGASAGEASPFFRIALWTAAAISLTAGFIWFCRRKTDGQWRWRWGKIGADR
jgi:hypothetical protein